MREFKEIRFHGRGGQGSYTATQIITQAALYEDKYAQSFPEFGAERQGAPIKAFARVSPKEITVHSGITDADTIIVIDPTLLPLSTWGYRDDSIFIAASSKSPEEIRSEHDIPDHVEVWSVDGVQIALDEIGRAITNTTMLGAFAKATGDKLVGLEALKKATEKVGEERGWPVEDNKKAMERAYNEVKKHE